MTKEDPVLLAEQPVGPMTDHTPNDLSHLSEAEFNALCPQGEHAPGPQPLSPAAQAVLDAAFAPWETTDTPQSIAAAALRAVVDQVTPEDFDYWYGSAGDYASGCETGQNERNAQVRAELLAIANELEGHEALI
jgi:hypothetical protein